MNLSTLAWITFNTLAKISINICLDIDQHLPRYPLALPQTSIKTCLDICQHLPRYPKTLAYISINTWLDIYQHLPGRNAALPLQSNKGCPQAGSLKKIILYVFFVDLSPIQEEIGELLPRRIPSSFLCSAKYCAWKPRTLEEE